MAFFIIVWFALSVFFFFSLTFRKLKRWFSEGYHSGKTPEYPTPPHEPIIIERVRYFNTEVRVEDAEFRDLREDRMLE